MVINLLGPPKIEATDANIYPQMFNFSKDQTNLVLFLYLKYQILFRSSNKNQRQLTNRKIGNKKKKKEKLKRPVAGGRLDPLAWRLASISPPLKGEHEMRKRNPKRDERRNDMSIKREERLGKRVRGSLLVAFSLKRTQILERWKESTKGVRWAPVFRCPDSFSLVP